jgi:hypothetical protein
MTALGSPPLYPGVSYHDSPGWSHSRLSTVERCPHLLGQGIDSLPMRRGRAVHEVFEKLGRHCKVKRLTQDYAAAEKIVDEVMARYGPDLGDEYSFARFLSSKATQFNFPDVGSWGAEIPFAVDAGGVPCRIGDPQTWFRGKLDLLVFGQRTEDGWFLQDDVVTIIDWKTNRFPPTASQWLHGYEHLSQLDAYAWLVFCHYPEVGEVVMVNEYLVDGTWLSHRLDREKLDEIEKRLRERVTEAERRLNSPPFCGNCSTCAAYDVCPQVKKPPRPKKALDSAGKKLAEAERLKAKAKAIEDELKSRAREGPVKLDDGHEYRRVQKPTLAIRNEALLANALHNRADRLGKKFKQKVLRFVTPKDLMAEIAAAVGVEEAEKIERELIECEALMPSNRTTHEVVPVEEEKE